MNRMRETKRLAIVIFILVFLGFCPYQVSADGVAIGTSGLISEAGQKALIVWDENNEKETLVINTTFSGINSLSDFCWILPIPSSEQPIVETAEDEVFELLEDLFPQLYQRSWYAYDSSYASNWGGYGRSTVEVLSIQEIGIYDLTTLWASDPNDLTDWLIDHGYSNLPTNFSSVVRKYTDTDTGCYFVLNKIDLENEFIEPFSYILDCSPTTYLRLTDDDSLSLDDIDEQVNVLKIAVCNNILSGLSYDPNSLTGYIMTQSQYTTLKNGNLSTNNLQNQVKNYILSSELFTVIIDLFEGAGTPVKITFYPEKPIFPLYISSLDDTYGGIDLYFIGPDKVKDKNAILYLYDSITLSSDVELDLEDLDINIPNDCQYISLLLYRGYLDSISKDSIFETYRQSSSNYPTNLPVYPLFNPIFYPTIPSISYPIIPQVMFPNFPLTINISWPAMNFSYPFSGGFFGFGNNLFKNNYNSIGIYGGFNNYGGFYQGNSWYGGNSYNNNFLGVNNYYNNFNNLGYNSSWAFNPYGGYLK